MLCLVSYGCFVPPTDIKAHVTRGKAGNFVSLNGSQKKQRAARIRWPLAFAAGILAVRIGGRSPC